MQSHLIQTVVSNNKMYAIKIKMKIASCYNNAIYQKWLELENTTKQFS